ncbi:cell division cycle 2, cofactor of APC complex [Nematocida displodere]|uniref:Cell division cycle 2, cofactor of APC complex n=1 Tax=Nematocida displodere TaxID=1805483 RepID=A0A177EC18_9MICR|nr:cell division cycle 2, cofactor of APC complex [Nematocida displodere]
MDHRELDDLWDVPLLSTIEPRYARVKKEKKIQERFHLTEERKRPLGFPNPVFFSGRLAVEPRRERLAKRPLAKSPFRVLDAPSILNDYYLNLLDWGPKDVVALGLSDHLYMWDAHTKSVTHLASASANNYISGVSFSRDGTLAAGMSDGIVEIYDPEKGLVCTLPQRNCRTPSISWGPGMVSVGAKDGSIFNYDVRSGEHVSSFLSHTQEVCGLKWDADGVYLASGANDNTVCVWRAGCVRPKVRFEEHTAAVRAVAWCPWKKGVLSTGGGTGDRTIKTWDVEQGSCLDSLDTGSQVCSIVFSERYKEIITTHGYSDNNICVWKFCSMRKIGEMKGHTDRVLFSALSPGGDVLATCAADENLNFWVLFDQNVDRASPGETVVLR